MATRPRQSGFSAAELAVVVAVIGILAAITVPNAVTAYNSYTLQIGANNLEQQLNRCRQEAVRANQATSIRVSAHTSLVDVNRDGNYDSADGLTTTLSDAATITVFAPTNGIVTYTSRGEMPVAATLPSFTIVYGSKARVVSVDPRGACTVGPEIAAP
jgi:prepilin-type N-terminal cleavage/methylation domain-containing protein